MLIAIAVVGIVTTADVPDAPEVELGTPQSARIEHATAVQHVAPDHVRITLAFTVATDAASGTDVAIPIDLPRDAAIVGMRLSLGGQTNEARLEWSDAARKTYDRIVEADRDPALLEWRGATKTAQQLVLRVFPVSASTPARVSLDIVAERPIAFPQAEQRVVQSKQPRPMLGFSRQLGRKISLIATERIGRPELVRSVER